MSRNVLCVGAKFAWSWGRDSTRLDSMNAQDRHRLSRGEIGNIVTRGHVHAQQAQS